MFSIGYALSPGVDPPINPPACAPDRTLESGLLEVNADPSNPSDLGVRPSWGPQKRERIPVGKMFGMPQGRALVWLPSDEAPRMARVRGYFDIPKLAARADPNPYYGGDPILGGIRTIARGKATVRVRPKRRVLPSPRA
jgi:hypothetical protein